MNPYLLINLNQRYKPTLQINAWKPLFTLMKKLSYKLQIICALEAAKIALPIWNKSVSKFKLTTEQKEAPRKAVEMLERWLDGKASIDEIKNAATLASSAIFAASSSEEAAASPDSSIIIGRAIFNAADAAIRNSAANAANAINMLTTSLFNNIWKKKCFPLIEKEFQYKYDILNNNINGEV